MGGGERVPLSSPSFTAQAYLGVTKNRCEICRGRAAGSRPVAGDGAAPRSAVATGDRILGPGASQPVNLGSPCGASTVTVTIGMSSPLVVSPGSPSLSLSNGVETIDSTHGGGVV